MSFSISLKFSTLTNYSSIILDKSRPSRLHGSLKAVGDSKQFLEFFSTIG